MPRFSLTQAAITKTFRRLPRGKKGSPEANIIATAMQPVLISGSWQFHRYYLHATKGWRRA